MANKIFDDKFYKRMKEHYESKGVKCESAKTFADIQNARSATFTLKPHAEPLVIERGRL